MELVVKTDEKADLSAANKFGKMIVGATVGFIATALAEKMYDSVLKLRQGKASVELEK